MSDQQRIYLSELVAELRNELLEAQKEGVGKELRFQVEEVEIELKVGVTKDVKGKTGVKFWVYNAELEGGAKQQDLQRVLLKFKPAGPQRADGKKNDIFEVGGKDARPRKPAKSSGG